MFKAILVSTALVLVSQLAHAQQRQPNCVGPQIILAANQNVSNSLTVKQGTFCNRNMTGGRTQVTDIVAITKPRHGTVTRVGRVGYRYTPARGYTGPDSFDVRYVGYAVDDFGNKAYDVFFGVTTNVTVTP